MTTHTRRAPSRSSSPAPFERLERRQLMSVSYGTNVIQDASGESYAGTADRAVVTVPTHWTGNDNATVAPYSQFAASSATFPLPPDSGKVMFTGGPDSAESDFFQTIDLSSVKSDVDANHVTFALSGYLGGYGTQNDATTLFVNLSGTDGLLSQVALGPVTASTRGNNSGLKFVSTTGSIPAGTRTAQVQLHFVRTDGTFDDAYADNLSLTLAGPSTKGGIAGTVYNDADGDGTADAGEGGLAGVKVFLDKNNNGTLDAGETSATTTSSGTYAFAGLSPATYAVRQVVPGTFRATSANPLSVTVASGSTATGKNFGDSQTVLISGTVFADANGNKKQDSGEAGLKGVTVYLDFNNNGQLDSFESKATTDSSGKYSFVVPFGTYVVRQVTPGGYAQTTAPSSMTFAKGAVSGGLLFGDKKV